MSRCLGCFFHESGYMFNRCNFFEIEYYGEPDDCEAFSIKPIPDDEAKKLFEKITGAVEAND